MKNTAYLLGLFVVIFALSSAYFYERTNELERKVVAGYSNELNRTSEQLTELQSAVHQSIIFQDEVAQAEQLSTITRLASSLKQSINNLPLNAATSAEWNQYLSRIGSAANEAKTTNNESWVALMQEASKNLDEIIISWNDSTYDLMQQVNNFSKWQLTQQQGSPQFEQHAKLMTTYRETDFPLTASESDHEKKKDLHDLMDVAISEQEAIDRFKSYFPEIKDATLTVTKSKKTAAYPFYHIQFVQGARIGYADVTEKGGHIISFLLERPFKSQAKSHEQVKNNVEQFLKKVGYEDVTYVESRENENVWHFVYSRTLTDGTIVYPDTIQVKAAKDVGEVIGINAMEYIQKEKIEEHPIQTLNTAQFFQPHIEVLETKKIIANNQQHASRTSYEMIVRNKQQKNQIYRIILDAETHAVLKIEKMN